jgi:hypothetical protein
MSNDPYCTVICIIADAMEALDAEKPSRCKSLVQTKLDEAMMWAERGRRNDTATINRDAAQPINKQ